MFEPDGDLRHNVPGMVGFRAGIMIEKDRIIKPDIRKGFFYIYQGIDGHYHFCWKNRKDGQVEVDVVLLPFEHKFAPVPACKTGRVYVLKTRFVRNFYWMQEPSPDKDEDMCLHINYLINNPPIMNKTENSIVLKQNLQFAIENAIQYNILNLIKSPNRVQGIKPYLDAAQQETTSVVRHGGSCGRCDYAIFGGGPYGDYVHIDDYPVKSRQSMGEDKHTATFYLDDNNFGDECEGKKAKETFATPPFQAAMLLYFNVIQFTEDASNLEVVPAALAAASRGDLEDFVVALEATLPNEISVPDAEEEGDEDEY